jgi:Cu-processing system permease protein
MLLVTGILLTIIFTAIAMLATVRSRDKARGIGLAILLWLYFSVLFDGLVLLLLFQLSDYPLEKWMVAVSVLNPIDLARILILLKMDLSAMMGYTGAVFKNFFGTFYGITTSILVLLLWAAVPAWLSVKRFKSKDL